MFAIFNFWTYLCCNNFSIWDFSFCYIKKIVAVVKSSFLKSHSKNSEDIIAAIIYYSTVYYVSLNCAVYGFA